MITQQAVRWHQEARERFYAAGYVLMSSRGWRIRGGAVIVSYLLPLADFRRGKRWGR